VRPAWVYPWRALGEAPFPDGTSIVRPAVPFLVAGHEQVHLGVVDSGSPLTVTSRDVAVRAGIDITSTAPLMEVPLGLGARFDRLPVFMFELELQPPSGTDGFRWTLPMAVQSRWRFPFEVLFGQRGWFDSFTTTFGPGHLAVEPLASFGERFSTGG